MVLLVVRCKVAQPRPLKVFEGRMWLAVLATLGLSAQAVRVDICARYPNPDPCLPGGVWDPILNRYIGVKSLVCLKCSRNRLVECSSRGVCVQSSYTKVMVM